MELSVIAPWFTLDTMNFFRSHTTADLSFLNVNIIKRPLSDTFIKENFFKVARNCLLVVLLYIKEYLKEHVTFKFKSNFTYLSKV